MDTGAAEGYVNGAAGSSPTEDVSYAHASNATLAPTDANTSIGAHALSAAYAHREVHAHSGAQRQAEATSRRGNATPAGEETVPIILTQAAANSTLIDLPPVYRLAPCQCGHDVVLSTAGAMNLTANNEQARSLHAAAYANGETGVSRPSLPTAANATALPYRAPDYSLLGFSAINQAPRNQGMMPTLSQTAQFSSMQKSASDVTLSTSQIAARQAISKDLPTFSGKPDEWPVFITNYVQSTERCGFSEQENLIRLQKCLKGPALEAVRGKLMMPAMVPSVIETLRMLYGRPDVIHYTLQLKLKQEPSVRKDNLQTLINFALAVQNYRSTMEAIGLGDYLNDPMLLNALVEKLPGDLKLDWGRHRIALAGRADIVVFDTWLFNLATCASQVTPCVPSSIMVTDERKSNYKQPRERVFIHEVAENACVEMTQSIKCPKCASEHNLEGCSEFRRMSTNDRWQFIRNAKLCLRCFRNHYVRRCSSKGQCGVDGCKRPHHHLLHTKFQGARDNAPQSGNQAEQQRPIDNHSVLFHAKERKTAIFRYIPVRLHGKDGTIEAYALMDEGSACTLIEDTLAAELGLEGPAEGLCLQWTGDVTQTEENSQSVSLDISACEQTARKFQLRNVRTVSNLDLPEQTLDVEDIRAREHLKGLPICAYNKVKARMLIGLDNAKLGVPLEVRESNGDGLIGVRCRLGWTVYGRQGADDSAARRVLHVCPCRANKSMDQELKHYFSLEAIGVKAIKPFTSKEDERAKKIMESTTRYIPEEERWETGLLWKHDSVDLPDSLPMARRRLLCLEAKMARDAQLEVFLVNKIREYEEKGYVRKLRLEEVSSGGKSWYIPIFTVLNKNKNKTRLVWDAAATVNDVALNSVLSKGPDLLQSLVGVLIRFREKPVALCGDIREMFHQVRIIRDDQMAQQFLWRDGDASRDIDVYCMSVMTFGAACSPALANYIKDKNAKRFASNYPEAVDAIIRNTYVDDWLQCADTESEMIRMAKAVRKIHLKGGFEMRNWMSNSKRVLEALAEKSSKEKKRIEDCEANFDKVLGMWWLTATDEITFVTKLSKNAFKNEDYPTKREILRVMMSIFDPLGLVGFYAIYAKVLLQEVWRTGTNWDESIGVEQREKWRLWVRLLPLINDLRIPRYYSLVSETYNIQLHIFVDASINAYAAVAYLRAVQGDESRCSLVASKTRVAPLKPVSIPRLELMAAVLGLRLARFAINELSVPVNSRIFWTDSRNVLWWLKSDARKFHQFVALRIGEIIEDSDVNEWRWVPSELNVADIGTKWKTTPDFNGKSPWFVGPRFLTETEAHWPSADASNCSPGQEAVHHIEVQMKVKSPLAEVTPDCKRFSKWETLRRVQEYILDFLGKLTRGVTVKSPELLALLRVPKFEGAETIIMRRCQEEAFPEEIKCLRSGNAISRKSVIYKSSPYIDQQGLLRIKGRIDAMSGVPLSVKRPVILPRNHEITYLLADFYHRKFHHHHNEIVVNEMRQRFWVNGLRALVKDTSKRCQACRNRRAAPSYPRMGDLPPERLGAFARPFHYTGVDFFGPLEVVVGRRREKRWGALFTCLTVRAVHIEIAASLSTDSFLLVFKQFVSRRGIPRRVLSDNATNFRGASRILQNEIEKVSVEELARKHPEIEWIFTPPASPHMGGVWERMIRSVKSILMDILPVENLREEVLRAALADVENILNSRPLTYVPLDSIDDAALTPNHFLLGCSNGMRDCADTNCSGMALSRSFRIASQLADQFWKRWLREYLPCLTRRSKWHDSDGEAIMIEDIVIIADDNSKRNTWPKGIVMDVHRGKDGRVRSAVVKTAGGLLTRPVVKLLKLDVKG